MNHPTRRQFVQGGAAALLLGEHAAALAATASTSPRNVAYDTLLKEFDYVAVDFAPGPHQDQLEQTHRVLMGLDENSLLRPYRMAANLPAPGTDLGGWYSAPRFLGETFGQWISALSRYYAITADQPTRLKVASLVAAYAQTLEPTGNIFRLNGNPLYFHDKLVLGLVDAAALCKNDQAREVLSKLMDASGPVLEKKSSPEFYKKINEENENYNFAETYFMAWTACGDRRYRDLAESDLNDGFLDPLSRGVNVLPGRHAYSHVNTLCSAAKAYLALGDEKYLRAAINGFAFVERQSFATGGFGPAESFLPRPASPQTDEIPMPAMNSPGESILSEHHHFETGCGSYAYFKLTRYLLRITRDSRYGDRMERILYNAALGMLPLNKLGKAFYQSNYHRRATKQYFDGYANVVEDEWPCCSGSLPQLAADYRISAYFRDAEGAFVNLYIPSTLDWSQHGADVSLTQTGNYPLSDRIALKLSVSKPVVFTLRFRIPSWAQQPELHVNGKPAARSVVAGSFASVRRRWRQGDRVELVLPRSLRLEPADDRHPDLVALCCGPLVLFAIGEDLPAIDRQLLLDAKQIHPEAAEWRAGAVRFLPWWLIKDETYTTYHDVS